MYVQMVELMHAVERNTGVACLFNELICKHYNNE